MTDTVRIVVCGDEGEFFFVQTTIPNLLVAEIHRQTKVRGNRH